MSAKKTSMLKGLFEARMLEQITSLVTGVRDKIVEESLKDLIEFDANPYLEKVFKKMAYVDQSNDLKANGTRAEFKIYLNVVD